MRLTALAALAVASLITACGGGGDATPVLPTPDSASALSSAVQLQGRWVTASHINPARTGVVLPGSGTNVADADLWLLSADLLSLSKLRLSISGTNSVSATGKTYSIPSTSGNSGQAVSYSGSASLVNSTLSLNDGALLLTRRDTLKVASNTSDVLGNWQASFGGKAVTINWTISANDSTSTTLSGPGSTGCSYSGSLAARSDATALQASLAETCAGVLTNFEGIATYRAAQGSSPATLTLAMTSLDADQARALVVSLNRP